MVVRLGDFIDIVVPRYLGNAAEFALDRFGFFRNGIEVTPDRGFPETVRFAGPDRILDHEEGWGMSRFDISDAGLTWVTIQRDVEEFSTAAFIYDNGKLFFADGQTFDAET